MRKETFYEFMTRVFPQPRSTVAVSSATVECGCVAKMSATLDYDSIKIPQTSPQEDLLYCRNVLVFRYVMYIFLGGGCVRI